MTQKEPRRKIEVVFFEHNPFMSVELLDLLKNYKIACYNDDATYRLLKEKWQIFSYLNKEFKEELESDEVVELLLSDERFLRKLQLNKNTSRALFFYMNSKIDKALHKLGIKMVLPPYDIQEDLGNKLNLHKICRKLKILVNDTKVYRVLSNNSNVIFNDFEKRFELPFIVQGAFGASGGDTFLINNKNDFVQVSGKFTDGIKATRYIPNTIPISIHACITNSETIVHGPFPQLLGFPELSIKPFQFSGNDTNQSLFSEAFVDEVLSITDKITEYCKMRGYIGILGVDYLWDQDSGKIYVQELNTRLCGFTKLLTGIQKDQGLLPDLLKHIEIYGSVLYSAKCKGLKDAAVDYKNHQYSQVIVRNNLPYNITVERRIEPGIYRLANKSLKKEKDSLFVEDVEKDMVLITSATHGGCLLYPGEVIARFILKESVLKENKYELTVEATKIIEAIRSTMVE